MILVAVLALVAVTGCGNQQLSYDVSPECSDGFQMGNLLFVFDTAGGEGFCHVAITECDCKCNCDSVGSYVYEVNPRQGVVRIPFTEFAEEWYNKFDTTYGFTSYVWYYWIDAVFDTQALLNNLSYYMERPIDSVDGLSMVYDCFVSPQGKPIFSSSDTTLTLLAKSPLLHSFRIE